MYRLLIVDDEVLITDGLVSMCENDKDLEVIVFKAYSVQEAVEVMKRTRIDLVLTDINMPQLSGIDLMQIIRERWSFCKIIFLTGYASFDYVYSAIQEGGVRYLLKTEGSRKVKETIQQVIAEIEEEQLHLSLSGTETGEAAGFLQKEFLTGILEGDLPEQEISKETFEWLGIPLQYDASFLMIMIRITGQEPDQKLSPRQQMELCISIWKIFEQIFEKQALLIPVLYAPMTVVILLQPQNYLKQQIEGGSASWEKYIKDYMEVVQETCHRSTEVQLSFTIGEKMVQFTDCSSCFWSLRQSAMEKSEIGGEITIVENQSQQSPAEDSGWSLLLNLAEKEIRRLESLFMQGSEKQFLECYERISPVFYSAVSMNQNEVLEIYFRLVTLFLSQINRKKLSVKLAFKLPLYRLTRVESYKNWIEADQYLRLLITQLFALQQDEQQSSTNSVISKVEQYVEENLSGDLSLILLADVTSFNPTYLSRLFKQSTGQNLSDYICEQRIKRAKQLLLETGMKIQDISESVGYISASNFIRFFKKYTMMTPQEYRDYHLDI